MMLYGCTCIVESELICHKLVELTSLTGGYNGYISDISTNGWALMV